MNGTMFVLGGTGFIGREAVIQGRQAGWQVKALVRSEAGAVTLRQAGAQPVVGDLYQPESWAAEARDSTALIDLTQPRFPTRLSRSAIRSLSAKRQAMTRATLTALQRSPVEARPVFFSVSGADDLEPDLENTVSEHSVLRGHPRGFAHIGIPVRQLVEAAGIEATYVYFGNLVYGPGKVFADQYVTGLRNGSARIVGKGANRLPLTHVTDAAGALVHLAALPRTELVGRTLPHGWNRYDTARTARLYRNAYGRQSARSGPRLAGRAGRGGDRRRNDHARRACRSIGAARDGVPFSLSIVPGGRSSDVNDAPPRAINDSIVAAPASQHHLLELVIRARPVATRRAN